MNPTRRSPKAVVGVAAIALVAAMVAPGFGRREVEELRPVPPTVKTRRSAALAKGWEIILQPGIPGEERVLVRIKHWYGRERSRIDLSATVTKAPKSGIRLTGTARENAINAPRLTRVAKARRMVATGYDTGPHTNSWNYAGITKLGWRTRRGIVAVDPKVIPLRTLLYIEGYGLAWAGDVGGAIKGDRLDLCFNRTEDALAWGRRTVTAYILTEVRGE